MLRTYSSSCEGWKIVAAEQRALHIGEPPIPLVAGAAASSRRGGKRKAAGQNGGQESATKKRPDSDRRREGGPAADIHQLQKSVATTKRAI